MIISRFGYRIKYKFDIGPIKYFTWLFNKQPCPKCFRKLKRVRKKEITQPEIVAEKFSGFKKIFWTPHEIREIIHNFVCENCGAELTFDEVRRQKKK